MDWSELFGGADKQEQKSQFRNALLVMMADKNVDPREIALLELIRKRIGLSREEANEVIKNPQSVKFTPPKGEKEKFAHLVDLVFMMMIDGKIEPSEARIVGNFAVMLGFKKQAVPALLKVIADRIRSNKSRSDVVTDVLSWPSRNT